MSESRTPFINRTSTGYAESLARYQATSMHNLFTLRASIMTAPPHPMLTAERELGLTRIIRASPEKLFRAWRRW